VKEKGDKGIKGVIELVHELSNITNQDQDLDPGIIERDNIEEEKVSSRKKTNLGLKKQKEDRGKLRRSQSV